MTDLTAALERITPEAIDAHLRFLSHPLLEGRAPGTRGGELAVEYLRAQYRRMGLMPAGGSYLQEVPMVGLTPQPELVLLPHGERPRRLAYLEEFVLSSGASEAEVELESELVFVGYGIHAPELGWDDYKGIDVRGRVVIVLVNDPGTSDKPELFGGDALTYYGRWTYKFEEAVRRGAVGALLVHSDESAGYGWNVVRTSGSGEQFDLRGAPRHPLRARGWITAEVADDLFASAGTDAASMRAAAGNADFQPVRLATGVRAVIRSDVREVTTHNVLGIVPGQGPLADEAVILTSHHDHLGVGTDGKGRQVVYHGAYDNASGVALLLAIAEAATRLPDRRGRALVFAALTGEESGLLGAEWYVEHPVVPLARTAGSLNVDGANLQGRTLDLAPLGAERSQLGDLLREAAEQEGMTLSPDPHPEKGMFFRQDHFPFARAGVPAVALDHGLRFEGRPQGWGEQWYESFVAEHYHQPSDAYREGIDYGGALQQGRVLLRAALATAALDTLPEWVPEAGFGRSK
jgi:Zn-dependent M28 family amino/carboxypeptidase